MNGVRNPPSSAVKYCPRHGPAHPSQGLTNSAPLSPGKDHDCVVADPERVHGVEHLADVVIPFGEHVGPVAVPGLARERGIRQGWQVGLGERDVREEWLAFLDAALHECDRAAGDLSVNQSPLLDVIHVQGRLFRPLVPSMICSGGAVSLEYPGAEGHNASSVVQGMPNHSSKP